MAPALIAAAVLAVTADGLASTPAARAAGRAAATAADTAGDSPRIPDGLVSGTPHVVRFRPRLRALPRPRGTLTRRQRAAARDAIASCDPARLTQPARVPTTDLSDDTATTCVVLPVGARDKNASRALLGAARVTGDEILDVTRKRHGKQGFDVVVRLTARGALLFAAATPQVAALPLQVDVDGTVVGIATVAPAGTTRSPVPPRRLVVSTERGFDRDRADAIVGLIDQARSEHLVALADRATMRRSARELLGQTAARIDDKPLFVRDCPNPDQANTLVLGCYTGRDKRIYLLRVDRPDLAGVMTVTAAHEMLHAAYDDMTKAQRHQIVDELNSFMDTTGDQRIEELLAEYARQEPGQRDTELYALVGTQVGDLPRPIERHYRRFFARRQAIVDAFDAYEGVFDDLQAHYEQLLGEIHALEAQANDARAGADAAGAEANRLYQQIETLRAQGRFDESNNLVGPQNAAANRANGLIATFNSLVDQYNEKVAQINALTITINDTYNAIRPIPVELPPPT